MTFVKEGFSVDKLGIEEVARACKSVSRGGDADFFYQCHTLSCTNDNPPGHAVLAQVKPHGENVQLPLLLFASSRATVNNTFLSRQGLLSITVTDTLVVRTQAVCLPFCKVQRISLPRTYLFLR